MAELPQPRDPDWKESLSRTGRVPRSPVPPPPPLPEEKPKG